MELIETLYRQILLFSKNGDEIIEHPGFMLHEVCKITGMPRDEVKTAFLKMVELGFVEKVRNMAVAHRVKTIMSIDKLKTILDDN